MDTVRNPQHQKMTLLDGKQMFIAAPMSGLATDEKYKSIRHEALLVSAFLKDRGASFVYFAGQDIASSSEFSGSLAGLRSDIGALRQAHGFVMLFPEKVASSVLIEAGYAMALGLPMVLLVRDRRDLPFMFQEAEQVKDCPGVPAISIRQYDSDAALTNALAAWVQGTFGEL